MKMVCCCMPCFHKLQERLDPVPGSGPFTLCFSESVRWICIVIPVYLTVWRFAVLTEVSTDAAFWGILTGAILAFSAVVYLPLKYLALRYRIKHNLLKDYRWRPSIVIYIILCALPCFILVVIAIEQGIDREGDSCNPCALDDITTAVLQITVLGLTITEWMSKIREEHITYDLITAMALDFFFAYDCIQLIMMCTYDENIYKSNWVYVCFIFAFIAMFRYIPGQPVGVKDKGTSIGAAINIVVTMITVDIPFVIIRVWTMVEFGHNVSDIIHPLKNFAMICFGCTQLYIISTTRYELKKTKLRDAKDRTVSVSVCRRSRNPGVWDLDKGCECVKDVNGNAIGVKEESGNTDNTNSSHMQLDDFEEMHIEQGHDNPVNIDSDNGSALRNIKKKKSSKRTKDIDHDPEDLG